MKRRLFNIFTMISLLLFVATAVLWVRNYFEDIIFWRTGRTGIDWKQWLFNICSAASLLLCVTMVVLSVRSCRRAEIGKASPRLARIIGEQWAVLLSKLCFFVFFMAALESFVYPRFLGKYDGRVIPHAGTGKDTGHIVYDTTIYRYGIFSFEGGLAIGWLLVDERNWRDPPGSPEIAPHLQINGVGLYLWPEDYLPVVLWDDEGFLGFDMGTVGRGDTASVRVRFPYWLLLLLALVLPANRAIYFWRKMRRIKNGLCEKCGCELRANENLCPECGTPIVAYLAEKA